MTHTVKPLRILVRTAQKPDANLAPLKSTEAIGGNQGNLLYMFSVCRALATEHAVVTTARYSRFEKGPVEQRAEWINSEFDHLVLPLSSSFRLQMIGTLQIWAELIERLTIPVTVVGIGAQLRMSDLESGSFRPSRVTGVVASNEQIERHEAVSRRFVHAVLDRTHSIGVRGDVTRRYLRHLGAPEDQIDVIGCPSIFMWGQGFKVPVDVPRIRASSKISMSFDHRLPATADLLDRSARAHARLKLYAQEKLVAQMVITGEETRPDWAGDPRFPVQTTHPLSRAGRVEYCPTAWSWIRHMGEMDFALGPRLHGTIASILGGTPAHLLIHDSRTLEIAQHHRLPYTMLTDVTTATTAKSLAERLDFTAFNEAYEGNFDTFIKFLERNSLPHAYGGTGGLGDQFDARNRRAAAAKPILSNGVDPEPLSWDHRARKLGRRIRRALTRPR